MGTEAVFSMSEIVAVGGEAGCFVAKEYFDNSKTITYNNFYL